MGMLRNQKGNSIERDFYRIGEYKMKDVKDKFNFGKIYPKVTDSIGISSKYFVSKQHIDQNGVINVYPKFISWSLVSEQNLVDKNCRLKREEQQNAPYWNTGIDSEDFISPPRPACKNACFQPIHTSNSASSRIQEYQE